MNSMRKNILIMVLMYAAAGLSMALHPTHRIADDGPKINLESMIPKQFGTWKLDETIAPINVSPEVQERLNILYDQTLSRTYVNAQGKMVMLSIAYGGNQGNDDFQVHRPEYCYHAQGFKVSGESDANFDIQGRTIPIRRLLATQRQRVEPITYWITIGEKATLPGISRKLIQLRYGLTGVVPDGVLVRVSSIGSGDEELEYKLQQSFILDLLASLKPSDRAKLIGS
jgi:EpsI family protein